MQPGEPRWGSDRTFLSILREKNLFCLLSAVPGTAGASSVCLSPSTRRGGALIPFHRCGNRGSEKLSAHRWKAQARRGEAGDTSERGRAGVRRRSLCRGHSRERWGRRRAGQHELRVEEAVAVQTPAPGRSPGERHCQITFPRSPKFYELVSGCQGGRHCFYENLQQASLPFRKGCVPGGRGLAPALVQASAGRQVRVVEKGVSQHASD